MSYFQGKVITVTGGTGGLGSAAARSLALQGAQVSVADYQVEQTGDIATGDVGTAGGRIKIHKVDIRNEAEVRAWIETTVEGFGKLDGCVNFAGIVGGNFYQNDIDSIVTSEWQRTLDINLTGTMNCMRAQIPHMNSSGSIINISSVFGHRGTPKTADYSASKAGIIGLSRCAARELAGKGIRVNAIAPGSIATEAMLAAQDAFEHISGAPVSKIIPMGRMGKPEEVADLVEFLLSDKSTYITGTVIDIDGGWSA